MRTLIAAGSVNRLTRERVRLFARDLYSALTSIFKSLEPFILIALERFLESTLSITVSSNSEAVTKLSNTTA